MQTGSSEALTEQELPGFGGISLCHFSWDGETSPCSDTSCACSVGLADSCLMDEFGVQAQPLARQLPRELQRSQPLYEEGLMTALVQS